MKREDRHDVRVRTSKALAYILRHGAPVVGVTFDDEGFATVDDVLKGLHVLGRIHHDLTREALLLILDDPNNPRYERQGDRIRARYGHSAQMPPATIHDARPSASAPQAPPVPAFTPAPPPAVLFHGTTVRAATAILAGSGLQPQSRQFVHLSTDLKEASRVGLRHNEEMTILRIDAAAAAASGIEFSHAGEHTWVTPAIPAHFISIEDEPPVHVAQPEPHLLPPLPRREEPPRARQMDRPAPRTAPPPRLTPPVANVQTPSKGRDRPPIVVPKRPGPSVPETPPTTGTPSTPPSRGPAGGQRPFPRRRPNRK